MTVFDREETEGVRIAMEFDPPLPKGVTEEDLTGAQKVALLALQVIEEMITDGGGTAKYVTDVDRN